MSGPITITTFGYGKVYEKGRKMKKAFCFNICPCYCPWKNVSYSNLSFSQVTSVGKRELQEHFSASALPQLKKNFPSVTFFLFSNLGKTQIRVGHIFPQTSMDKYRNKIQFFNLGCQEMIHCYGPSAI